MEVIRHKLCVGYPLITHRAHPDGSVWFLVDNNIVSIRLDEPELVRYHIFFRASDHRRYISGFDICRRTGLVYYLTSLDLQVYDPYTRRKRFVCKLGSKGARHSCVRLFGDDCIFFHRGGENGGYLLDLKTKILMTIHGDVNLEPIHDRFGCEIEVERAISLMGPVYFLAVRNPPVMPPWPSLRWSIDNHKNSRPIMQDLVVFIKLCVSRMKRDPRDLPALPHLVWDIILGLIGPWSLCPGWSGVASRITPAQ